MKSLGEDVDFDGVYASGVYQNNATCTSCHDATPTDQHIDNTGPTAFGANGITYTYNSTNIDDYTAAGCAANCHSDSVANSGTGKWYRK